MSPLRNALRLLVVAAAMLALAGATAAGCGDDEDGGEQAAGGGATDTAEDREAQAGGDVRLSEVIDSPFQYYGDTVTVSGQVSEVVLNPGVFTIGGTLEEDPEGVQNADPEQLLPVIALQEADVPREQLSEGTTVVARGTVCQVVANLDEFGEQDFFFEEDEGFDEGFFTEFDQEPGLFASAVEVADAEAQGDGQGATVTIEQQGGPEDCPGLPGGTTTDGGE